VDAALEFAPDTMAERNRFLLRLDDALRPLTNADAMMQAAAELLGKHLDVNRCAYGDIESDQNTMNLTGDYNRGGLVRSIVGRLKFSEFGEDVMRLMRENEPYVVNDVEAETAIAPHLEAYRSRQIRAVICVPVHKESRLVAAMAVHSLTPRKWTAAEIDLVRTVADRCWESIERIRIERSLRESEERYRSLFDAIDAGFCVIELEFDTHGRAVDYTFVEVNPAFARQTGLENVQGRSMRSLAPAHEEHWFEIYGEVARTGKPIRFEQRATALNNRWFDLYAFRFGKPSEHRVAVLFRDVSERHKAENALRESEAVLRTVTSEARVGLMMVNRARRYLFVNQTFADIFGLKDADVIGQRVADVLPELYEQIEPRLARALAGERISYELHVPAHPKTKDERFYEVVYEPRAHETEDAYVVVVIVDITERKHVEQTLEALVNERTAKLQDTIQELEGFSYSIAHDMRAPLRSMHGFANILIEDFGEALPSEAQNFLSRIESSAMRLDRLIQDVLSYSRIVRQTLPMQLVNVEDLIREIIETYPQLHAPGVTIEVAEAMPIVFGNVAALTQVISNLLGNAVKFVETGKLPRIRIWAERVERDAESAVEKDWVRLWFEDNGIGIPQQFHARIFGMFHRLNPTSAYEGTGIGLAIVRKAVERMGGSVGLESVPGKGTRFWVELKAAPAA
jgi:PAS domain S-box-containing protein